MQQHKLVCIGGGVATGYLVDALVEDGFAPEEICILSADSHPPYERPPLSKDFLTGAEGFDDIWINQPSYYMERDVTIELNTNVHKVDTENRKIFTDLGAIGYKQLVIATGAQPNRLDLPGAENEDIYYLRTAEDAQRLRQVAQKARSAVVIGGSFIGMEVSSSLRQNGLEVTMVYPEERVWQAIFTPKMSDFFEQYYRDRGVTLRSGASVIECKRAEDGVTVLLDDGSQITADIVVAGIGVTPNTELVEDTGIKIDAGIITDEYLETNAQGVYAVGDVAEYYDPSSKRHRRNEHWDSAVQQAITLAKTLTGTRTAFDYVPYFFSDIFDLSYEIWGNVEEYDNVLYRGEVERGKFSTWWFSNGDLIAVFVMDRPDAEREQAQEWLKAGARISPEDVREVA